MPLIPLMSMPVAARKMSLSKNFYMYYIIIVIMSTFLMQWNVRGLRANYASGLQPLIHTHNPQIICLQETKISNTYDINKYKSYHHINNNNLIAAGGSSIFVRSNLLQRHIPLTTDLQAVAVRITSHQPVLRLASPRAGGASRQYPLADPV